jgi:CrcB protein
LDKNVNLDFNSIIIVLFGSTLGLILRIFIQNSLKINMGFNIQNTSLVNFLSSFFLGILIALNFNNNNILLLFNIGFLGCFSTFSSFIYQLFLLFKKKKYMRLCFHYFEVIILSFICLYLGYYLVQFIK